MQLITEFHLLNLILLYDEAKEALRSFMIKSNKGKAGQEDKVLSLQTESDLLRGVVNEYLDMKEKSCFEKHFKCF